MIGHAFFALLFTFLFAGFGFIVFMACWFIYDVMIKPDPKRFMLIVGPFLIAWAIVYWIVPYHG